jgi:carbamoyltransferase
MANILGISAYFHDSSACLIQDGQITAAVLEERFSRIKHDSSFPEKAIKYCLEEGNISSNEIDEVIYFEKPITKFERILDTLTKQAPFGFKHFKKAIHSWMSEKFWVESTFKKTFKYNGQFNYCQHHLSHAANTCYQSGFNDTAYLIIDGVGEKSCTSYGMFSNNNLEPLMEQQFPHSIGLLYSAFTQYCGFKVNSGEYKLMGLAPYGTPKYTNLIYNHFVSITDDGIIKLSLEKFGFLSDLKMINKQFELAIGQPARRKESPLTQFYKDIAASIQKVTEELVLKLVEHVYKETKQTKIVLGGGVALNCVINATILEKTSFEKVFIHSASGDSGCSMGAALYANKAPLKRDLNQEFLGPQFTDLEIEESLKLWEGIHFSKLSDNDTISSTAEYLADNKIVGWFQGRMEFGPRALGNRSILGNPADPKMKSKINIKIKKREGFRPFAPVILKEHFTEYFEDNKNDYSRMLYVTKSKENRAKIPSCIHEDQSSRVQTLESNFNPKLHRLLKEFHIRTTIPILINTSFNERGEPIVCSPKDAIQCFFNTDMDILIMENYVIEKLKNLSIQTTIQNYELD